MAEAYLMIRDLHRPLDGDDEAQREELDDFPGGPRWLQAAIEVWRVAEPARADALAAVLERAQVRMDDELRFEREDLLDLVELLDGLKPRLLGSVVDATTWMPPTDRVTALSAQLPTLAKHRPPEELAGLVAEGIANTSALREFFARAVDAHADVVASY